MADAGTDVTTLLESWSRGEPGALQQLLPVVYDELRKLASFQMRREAGNTLQPTALAHEGYHRLVDQAVEFIATDAVRGFGQRMADDTRAEVESHRTYEGRAELKATGIADGAAEHREDGRRKEFAADLAPREGGLFEDPHRNALTHGGKCGHHAGRASAHN